MSNEPRGHSASPSLPPNPVAKCTQPPSTRSSLCPPHPTPHNPRDPSYAATTNPVIWNTLTTLACCDRAVIVCLEAIKGLVGTPYPTPSRLPPPGSKKVGLRQLSHNHIHDCMLLVP